VLWQKNIMTTLDLAQHRMVLGKGLKDIHGQRYQPRSVDAFVAIRLLMDEVRGPKNALLKLMDLHKLQIYGSKNELLEFIDLYFQSLWT
jgi:hypothetical protein